MTRKNNRLKAPPMFWGTSLAVLAAIIFAAFAHYQSDLQQANGEPQGLNLLASTGNGDFNVSKYLPAGAIVKNPDTDVVFADLDGDGEKEIVIFYSMLSSEEREADILILKAQGKEYVKFWQNVRDGCSGFASPSGVFNLKNNGMPQIIAYRTVGASCPGILDIFQYANGTMQTINGDWAGTCQSDLEIKDLNGDGIQEILFRKLKYGVNRDIYAWNGERYGLSNKKFAQTYGSELEEIIGYIYSPKSLPAPSRVRLCQQAVQIYRVQQRYSDAIKLCNDALKILDDPALTIPNTVMKGDETPEVKKQIDVSFEWEKLAAKATLYTLFGDVQKAAGHRKQAQLYYQQAQILKEQAEEMHKKSL